MVEWELFYDYYNAGQRLARTLDSESYIFLNCGSYGDVYPNMTLMESVAAHQKRKVVVILDKRWERLAGRFSSDRVSCIFFESEQNLKNALMSERRAYRFEPGTIYPLLPTMHPLLDSFYFQGFVTDLELKKILLRLPREANFILPPLSDHRKNEIFQIFKSTGCRPGQTCILSFNNNSNPALSPATIKKIADQIKYMGFDVLINSAKTFGFDSSPDDGMMDYPNIGIPSDAPIEFVEIAGLHLGTTNGLTQILYMFENKAKTAVAVNVSTPFIVVNGWTVNADWFLKFSNVLKKHKQINNNYEELHLSDEASFEKVLLKWLSRL
jgi:hypothetical protein